MYAKHEWNGTTWNKIADKYNTGAIPSGTAPQGSGNGRLELATGMSEDFKAYNIYDLAGNMWEWTTETGKNPEADTPSGDPTCKEEDCPSSVDAPHAVPRGGGFDNYGSVYPVVYAHGNSAVGVCGINLAFRVVLYLQ